MAAKIIWSEWPEVPQDQRPKVLHHNHHLTKEDLQELRDKGWAPTDVRLLPNETDADKAEGLKAYLEGLRLGTIILSQAVARYVEVEARVLGLTSGKGPEREPEKEKWEELDFQELMKVGGRTGHSVENKGKKSRIS